MKKYTLLVLFISLSAKAFSQQDSCWTVCLLQKGQKLEKKENMVKISKNGFCFYRNCIYDIEFKNNSRYNIRIVDIKPDSISFVKFVSKNIADKLNEKSDTNTVHIKELGRLFTIADRMLGLHSKVNFNDYNFIFNRYTINCNLLSKWLKVYTNDSTIYELVPYLTQQGFSYIYEENGNMFYFEGPTYKFEGKPKNTIYKRKNFFWFTPCNADEINGLAIGVLPQNTKNYSRGDSDILKIRGLYIDINPFIFISLLNGSANGPHADSIGFYKTWVKDKWLFKMSGLNISLLGLIREAKINGVNIAGLNTVVDDVNGLSVTGVNTFSYIMNRICISGIRNRSTIGRGLTVAAINHSTDFKGIQIGLLNKTKKLRGLQIGLWNINERRSLPIINW